MRVRRPWKRTLLVPACALNVSVPRTLGIVHLGFLRFARVSVLQRLLTLRPVLGCANVSVALAGSESLKRIVVPTGGLRLSFGRSEPRRNVLGAALAEDTDGANTVVVVLDVLLAG